MQQRTAKPPSRLGWEDLDAAVICAFLDHLEADRRNSPRTRNARLTAIRSLFAYAALHHPEHAALIARVLAIPLKRFDRATVSFSARPRSTRCWPRRSHQVGGPARSRHAVRRDPNRSAGLKTHWAQLR